MVRASRTRGNTTYIKLRVAKDMGRVIGRGRWRPIRMLNFCRRKAHLDVEDRGEGFFYFT
jgi:hypothetical protein